MKRLSDIGEDALIERLLRDFPQGGLHTGPGDDCAVVDPGRGRLRLLKTDAIVGGVHFEPGAPPAKVGWKAVARVLSDFAAMGGQPEFLMVTVALPADTPVRWVDGLYRGIRKCLATHGGVLAGGETTSVPNGAPVMISVAGEGSVSRGQVVLRSGGRSGDLLAVTGRLGGSIGGRHLSFSPRLAEGAWLAGRGATAMMDLSDGLAKDLPRLAKASGCGAVIRRDDLPRHRGCDVRQAMTDGEDYELLVALKPSARPTVEKHWPKEFAPLTFIGELAEEGEAFAGGWEHFQ
ncbi:thiamine-monophosphate kinase [Haloferula helveola]|uniref:Thiamine-monophosphate kinase n=1 Tax=Haloferula helveola TaxID=490095 RepID=A0ABM7RBD3_9BACT|nr:thiamine-monophosphate kinase [Haloferula helveola]